MSEVPEGFRDTPVGPLPETWEVVRLGDFVKVRYGKARPCEEGVIPAIGSGGIYAWVSESLVDFPTLIIGRKGTAGRVWLQEAPCWPSDTTFYLEWKSDGIDYRFVHHWLQERPLSGEHAKTTLPSLSRPDVENYLIPLPPLPEQRAISHVLQTVQRAREETDGVIAAVRELKRSLMRHLFTYGPVPVHEAERVELQETEIGQIPGHWEVVRLDKITREGIKNGAFVKRARFGSGVPFLNVADTYKNISVSPNGWERVEATEAELDKYRILPNDLFFVRSSLKREGVGQCCMVEEIRSPAIYDCHLMRVRIREAEVVPKYLAYYAVSRRGKRVLIARSKTTTMTTINQQGLGGFEFPLPRLAEQREIAQTLSTVDAKIAAEEARREALDVLFHSLLHHLMTGRIRTQRLQHQAARTPSREEENLGDFAS